MSTPAPSRHLGRPLPAWFDDAKFGIFVHWTAATVPAFAPVGPSPFELAATEGWEAAMARSPYVEWYQNSLSIPGSPVAEHHARTYGDLPYDAFVRRFAELLERWDPEPWADLFAAAGARYVVLVTKHHDGFLLWPSATPNPHKEAWQSERDVVGELAAAVRARGLRFGLYYSGGLDWTFGGLPMHDLASSMAAIPQSEEYLAYADAHWRELVDRYEPDVLWNDIGYPAAADLDGLFEDYYRRVPHGVVNDRFDFLGVHGGTAHADFTTPEYSTTHAGGRKWESTRGMGSSFGFNREEREEDLLAADDAVRLLAEVVAGGGNLLLNVGPAADGTIPWHQTTRLLGLGWWLRDNGPALFGTRPGPPASTTADGIPVVQTVDGDTRYALVLGTPATDRLELPVPLDQGAVVELLGHGGPLRWDAVRGGTSVELPVALPAGPAFSLRLRGAAG
jgi:alpha-L-fucosidase